MEEHPSREVNALQTGSFGQQSTDDGKRSFEAPGAPDTFDLFYQQELDELLEAMKSPQGRGFLLSLEARLISFVKDSKVPCLDTILSPNSPFYIVLAHRLTNYYHLTLQVGRLGDVCIFRTPFCRLPPSLESTSSPHTAGLTPPPVPPTTTRTGADGDSRFGHSRASSETSYLAKEKYFYHENLFCIYKC
jgi:hypothetical protein